MTLLTRASLGVLAALVLASASTAGAQAKTATANPHGGFYAPCAQCHRPDAWKPVKVAADFRHAPDRFPLEGAHARVSCTGCHTRLDFTRVTTVCASCHQDAHHGELGANCARCHSTRSFLDMARMRQAHQATAFPLTGNHLAVDCRSCHTPRAPGQLAFVNLPSRCESCHMAAYKATSNPPHPGAGFPTDCESCHSPRGWSGAGFDHARTTFPLTGAHRATPCSSCHADGIYKGKPTACVSCHQKDYNGTTNPGHVASGFPTACESCHTTTTWTGAVFDHSTTLFPLTGAHKATPCSSCHADGIYKGKPTACVSCHQKDYNGTTNPGHVAAGFPTACASCHTTTTWTGATFDHDALYFPIYSGRHKGVWSSCATCHTNSANYAVFDCLSCHGKSQTDPHHSGVNGYVYASNNCYSCHKNGRAP